MLEKTSVALQALKLHLVNLDKGLDKAIKEGGDKDTCSGKYYDTKNQKFENTNNSNGEIKDQIVKDIDALSLEELKIARDELKKSTLKRFDSLGDADVKSNATSVYDNKSRLRQNRHGAHLFIIEDNHKEYTFNAHKSLKDLMQYANQKIIEKSRNESEAKLSQAEFDYNFAHDQFSVRLSMADKLIKKGMTKEEAANLCLYGATTRKLDEQGQVYHKEREVNYLLNYNDSFKKLNAFINKHVIKESSPEEAGRIQSEFEIMSACIDYKKAKTLHLKNEVAYLDSEDKDHERMSKAHSAITESLKKHPACKDYNTDSAKSTEVRKGVAKILLDQFMKNTANLSDRLSLRIKEGVDSIKDALHIGRNKDRDITKVAKNIVAGLKKKSPASHTKIAPTAGAKTPVKRAQKTSRHQ